MNCFFKKKNNFSKYLSVCAVMKNEGPYLQEWIEYHRIVGVEQFYLYDNNSTDNTKEILEPYIKENIVKYKFWPDHPAQVQTYNDCLNKYKNDSFWIGFIDLDEFIVPVAKETIPEILIDYEKYGGLGVNWVVYGSSGYENKPEGLTIENFEHHSDKDFFPNKFIKTILNPRKSNYVEQHLCTYPKKFFKRPYTVTENKEKEETAFSPHNSTDVIRINHYFTRSKEEFIRKVERGCADFAKDNPAWQRGLDEFDSHNKNDIHDTIMRKYVSKVKEAINKTNSQTH